MVRQMNKQVLNQNITLDRLELYLLDLPQKSVFKSGIGTRKSKETLVIKWIDKDGRIGYGECSCRPDSYYSAEFLEAAVILIQRQIAPKLHSKQSYEEVLNLLNQIRGWNFTKAAVESSMFQVVKQLQVNYSLSEDLNSSAIENVPVGISLGIYDDEKQLFDIVHEAIEEGYQRVKFKISPRMKIDVFDHINSLMFDHKICVSFDANGSYRSSDLDKLRYFVEIYDAFIEQPTPPSRFDTYLRAKQMYPQLKVCFDEEVKSMGDLVKLKSLNAIDELNLKIGRVGGINNSIKIMNYCKTNDIPCWIGGMFETGIGRVQNLEMASFLPTAIAHDLSPSSRYFKEDIVTPEIKMEQGFINVKEAKLSVVDQDKIDKYTIEKIVIKK